MNSLGSKQLPVFLHEEAKLHALQDYAAPTNVSMKNGGKKDKNKNEKKMYVV